MLLSKMPKHDQNFGTYIRKDGEEFSIIGSVWESPSEYDYWIGAYIAKHKDWGEMRMSLTIPKKIAPTIDLARALVAGAPLDQVRSELSSATASGKSLTLCPSDDGWMLLG